MKPPPHYMPTQYPFIIRHEGYAIVFGGNRVDMLQPAIYTWPSDYLTPAGDAQWGTSSSVIPRNWEVVAP